MLSLLRDAKFSQNDVHTVFTNAETIISCMAYLNDAVHSLEQRYNQEIISIKDELDTSKAEAEARAKTTDSYKEWRKLKYALDLAEQQLQLLKKFASSLESEFKRI